MAGPRTSPRAAGFEPLAPKEEEGLEAAGGAAESGDGAGAAARQRAGRGPWVQAAAVAGLAAGLLATLSLVAAVAAGAGRRGLARAEGLAAAAAAPALAEAVGLAEARPFTCAEYGCLDVRSPSNPCQCSHFCVEDGSCCGDYQDTCAGLTPRNNPRLGYWEGCADPQPPPEIPGIWQYQPKGPALKLKVMSYNAEWWHVIEQMGGNGNGIAKTVMGAENPEPIDILGFQEFYDPWYGLTRPGYDARALLDAYTFIRGEVGGPVGTIISFRKSEWALIARGQHYVAKDKPGPMYYGERIMLWVRLYSLRTGKTLFVANHHGPLPVNTGGVCGGAVTAANLLRVIGSNAQPGDAIILMGDFNADGSSQTIGAVSKYLHRNFGGIDNIFTNLPQSSVFAPIQVGSGGSDHNAITVVLNLAAGQ